MQFFPALILLCSAFWAGIFSHEKLLPPAAVGLHLVLAILLFGVALGVSQLFSQRLLTRLFWHAAWGLVFVVWNVAASGNYLAQRNWGDPLNFPLFRHFIEYDPELPRLLWDLLSFEGLGMLLGSLALLWMMFLLHQSIARRLEKYSRLSVVGSILIAGVFSLAMFYRPSMANSTSAEPITAFFLNTTTFNLNGLDTRRAKAIEDDRQVKLNYDSHNVRPTTNVIVLVLDALRADHLPMYGYQRNTAPFLNKLFQEGTLQKVEDAFSACSESFCGIAALLTSRPYHQVSLQSLKFYELLKSVGYKTDLILTGEHAHFADLGTFYGPEVSKKFDCGSAKLGVMDTDRITLKYLEQLPKFDGTPQLKFFFMMSTHILGEHFSGLNKFTPADTSPIKLSWNNKNADQVLEKIGRPRSYLQEITNSYDNGILQGDWVIQQIFERLKAQGYLEDAIVFITGDHGDALGEHNHLGHTYRLYNEDTRVPLLVWDSTQRPLANRDFTTHLDLAPTVFDRLGLPIPSTWSGTSLYQDRTTYSLIQSTRRGREPCVASLAGDKKSMLKLIACKSPAGFSEELYDLKQDPKELTNLVLGLSPEAVASLRRPLDFFYDSIITNSCKRADCID